jgi:methylated-DNA-[protein]-cysteine S-methyltransferase
MTLPHIFTKLHSPLGELTLVATKIGLRAVLWPQDHGRVVLPESIVLSQSESVLSSAATQIEEYFAGERKTFDLPLDLHGTDFQKATWGALAEIPYGVTWTYGQQAEHIGRPKAVRAVGAANGRNPVSIVLPCHRVIGADGSLTGFAGGLEAKQHLLVLEGALETLEN